MSDTYAFLKILQAYFDARELNGKFFLVTGAGKYFKNIQKDPASCLGIIRIADNGAQLLWGYNGRGTFTSELPAHLMSHIARLKVNSENRVIMHTHPTYTLAMNFVHELEEKTFTHSLWELCTECIVVFPDGIGILPWMLCGTNEIGEATALKMKDYRIVLWAMHGVYAAGNNLDETYGLVETVEKAAQIYMLTRGSKISGITDKQLEEIAEAFGVKYRKDFLRRVESPCN